MIRLYETLSLRLDAGYANFESHSHAIRRLFVRCYLTERDLPRLGPVSQVESHLLGCVVAT